MIQVLNAEECRELLAAAVIGRLGFVHDGRVEILPVNYVLDGDDIIIRAAPDGLLSELPSSTVDVAFEVDYIAGLGGMAWSVLLSGSARVVSDPEEVAALAALPLYWVGPWAGGDRSLHLRFTASRISGRRVRHERNT